VIAAYDVAAVRAAEGVLLATLPEGELMARAVEGLAAVAAIRVRERGGHRVTALVGPGNNGADALHAVARLAADGHLAGAVLLADRVHEGALAQAQAAGVVLVREPDPGDASAGISTAATELIGEADVVLDGILGIGARAGLPAYARAWVGAIPDSAYVIAVDLPSGQDPMGSGGDPDGVFADETVTFSCAKPVHLLPAGEPASGLLTIIDIGLDFGVEVPALQRLDRVDVASLWPVPGVTDDKYSRGVLGIIAGSENFSGAAVLAVTAAANAGVGMVRYVGTATPQGLVRAAVPEAVHGLGRVQAWVIGPGLEVGRRAAGASEQLAAARAVLDGELPLVLDAGGLDLLTGPRAAPTILTPHAGECARLLTRLGDREVTRSQVSADPLRYARELASATTASVLLKGAWSIVVGPDGTAYSQNDGPAWLATAGSGDVLAGLLGSLLAAGLPATSAGALAALVHGVAAQEANPGGPIRALRVAEALPQAIAGLLRAGIPD
jgi:hydroxyethylthiazole kinase-like uncharacterized protein yjeF